MRFSYIVILILVMPVISADLIMSEIMFNPDNGNEWVELFVSGNTTYNISQLTLTDNLHTDNIVCCGFDVNCSYVLPENSFIIIFDQDTTINTSNLSYFCCVDDNAIGNGLGNSKDQIILSENSTVLVNFSYSTSVDKGNSLSLINGTWIETTPTIGKENIITIENTTSTYNETQNSTVSNNTINQTNNVSSQEDNLCNISLSIKLEKQFYNTGEKVEFYNYLNNKTFSFKIEYWIEDLFGNIIKNKVETKNTNKKSYTPKINGPEKVFIIKNNLIFVGCNNTNNKTKSEKIFVVKGSQEKSSLIDIEKIYLSSSNTVSFGERVRVKLTIYKGDTNKNSLKAYVKKDTKSISYITYFNVYEKYQNYDLTIPVQLKPNCNKNYKDGTYYVYIEGLDKKVKEKITVEGYETSLCGSTVKSDSVSSKKESSDKSDELINSTSNETKVKLIITRPKENNQSYSEVNELPKKLNNIINNNKINSTLNLSNKVTGNVVYTSSTEKIKNYALFLVVLVIVLILFAWFKTR